MDTEQEIYFHVGLGKVASTYLQQAVFPRLQGVHYISTHSYRKSKAIIPRLSAEKVLVSREFDRQLEEEVRWFTSTYPQARVIILLRRHGDWIASQYKRHVKNGWYGSFEAFLDLENDAGYWKQKDLCYAPMLRVISECCTHPPLVLFYDDLKSNPEAFLNSLAGFMDVPAPQVTDKVIHPSFSEKQLKVLRTFCRKVVRRVPINYQHKWKHWLLYRPVWAFYHLILYGAALLPDRWVGEEPLIDPASLEEVNRKFEADWKAVREW